MPYKSLAQERYFNVNKAKLSKQGVNVNEWNKTSQGKKLPEHVGGKKRGRKPSKPGDKITKMNALKAANPRKKVAIMGLV